MRKLIAGLLVTLLLVTAGTVYAGERAGAFSLSPFAGGYTFDGAQQLTSGGVLQLDTAPVYGLRLGYDVTKSFGVELVGDYLATQTSQGNKTSVNAVSYRLDFLYNFMADGPLVPYLAVGGGGITLGHGEKFSAGGRNTFVTANAGLGLKYFLTDSVALRGDARQLFIFPEAHNSINYNWEYTAGLTFLFGGEKPVPPSSSLSAMPGSIMKGDSATLSWTSQNVTNCAIQPGVGSVQPQGSTKVSPAMDTTYTLSCSGKAGTTSSMVNVAVTTPPPPPPPAPISSLSVTPVSITKGDTATLNWSSQNAANCDLQPGIGPVKAQGSMAIMPTADTAYTLTCTGPGGSTTSMVNVAVAPPPPPPPVVLTEKEESVNLLIEFDFNKAVVKPEFYPNVDAVGEFMKKYPTIDLTVEGHTDSVGGKAYNQKLSMKRAEAVKKYIVDKFGIDAKRIKAVGYGETKPIDTNKTAEGRYHNRRVQATHGAVK